MIQSMTATHSSINWASTSAILGVIIAGLGLIIALIQRRERKQQEQNQEIKREITESIDHLSEVLLAKLETKEKVSQISERLARIEGQRGITNTS